MRMKRPRFVHEKWEQKRIVHPVLQEDLSNASLGSLSFLSEPRERPKDGIHRVGCLVLGSRIVSTAMWLMFRAFRRLQELANG